MITLKGCPKSYKHSGCFIPCVNPIQLITAHILLYYYRQPILIYIMPYGVFSTQFLLFL